MSPPGAHAQARKYRIPLGRPTIAAGRKSESFWSILGKFGIFSTVLRVRSRFPGTVQRRVLSAMNVPDVKGSQARISISPPTRRTKSSGQRAAMPSGTRRGRGEGELPGPENTLVKDGGELRIRFRSSPRRTALASRSFRLPDQTLRTSAGSIYRGCPSL
jgi:hypothetical protein